jgi:hypothetical protein
MAKNIWALSCVVHRIMTPDWTMRVTVEQSVLLFACYRYYQLQENLF